MMKNNIQNVRISKDKNGRTCLDYGRIKKPVVFRYCILNNIIKNTNTDIIILADTNQRITGKQTVVDEEWLKERQLRYAIIPVQRNPQYFFGFKIASVSEKRPDISEKRIVILIDDNFLRERLFKIIENNDILIGFGSKKSFEDILEAYRVSGEKMLFDAAYFKDSLYDSVICTRLRSTLEIEKHLEAIKNEMDL